MNHRRTRSYLPRHLTCWLYYHATISLPVALLLGYIIAQPFYPVIECKFADSGHLAPGADWKCLTSVYVLRKANLSIREYVYTGDKRVYLAHYALVPVIGLVVVLINLVIYRLYSKSQSYATSHFVCDQLRAPEQFRYLRQAARSVLDSRRTKVALVLIYLFADLVPVIGVAVTSAGLDWIIEGGFFQVGLDSVRHHLVPLIGHRYRLEEIFPPIAHCSLDHSTGTCWLKYSPAYQTIFSFFWFLLTTLLLTSATTFLAKLLLALLPPTRHWRLVSLLGAKQSPLPDRFSLAEFVVLREVSRATTSQAWIAVTVARRLHSVEPIVWQQQLEVIEEEMLFREEQDEMDFQTEEGSSSSLSSIFVHDLQ